MRVGHEEARAIWPQNDIDIVLSMGTGTSTASARTGNFISRLWDTCFVARLLNAFGQLLEGEDHFKVFRNYVPESKKDRYFRLNVKFQGREPKLDDIHQMHQLHKEETRSEPIESEIVESLVAKQIYFEFDQPPLYSKGRYYCNGHLHCRFQGGQQAELVNHLLRVSAVFSLNGCPIKHLRKPLNLRNGMLAEYVEFSVKHLEEEFAISLGGFSIQSRAISGFPTTAAALSCNQGFDNVFGDCHHTKRLLPPHDGLLAPSVKRHKREPKRLGNES